MPTLTTTSYDCCPPLPPRLISLHLSLSSSSTMSRNSPTYSSPATPWSASSFNHHEEPRYDISCARGAVAPMPSLMSHPPLLQINTQTHLVHRSSFSMRRRASLLPPSWQHRTPSPSASSGSSASASQSSKLMEFPCSYCNQVYKRVGYLNRHILTHSGTRFRCKVEGCGKTFSRRDNMGTQ
jgi:hypothetical protein